MIQGFARVLLSVLGCCLLLSACATVRLDEDIADYQDTIEQLQRQVEQEPGNANALRDLGVIYARTNNFARANEYLQLAFSRDPGDPKTLFYLGLANESLGKPETALALYEQYPDVSGPYRRLMAGRYAHVTRQIMQETVRQRIRDEANLQAEQLEPRIVAVYPLIYQGAEQQYEPLGRGLAEMISVDLAHVRALRLVERARLQTLLDEIALGRSQQFDPATAPRVGRLIGAGRLVGGVYNVLAGDDLRLDAALWEADRGTLPGLESQSDALRNFFALEKRLVFDLLDEIGIELSPEERQAIEFIPTQNLQAFLAYSRGLEREDAGAFGEAAGFYAQAARLDPGFQAAREKADEMDAMALAGGTVFDAMIAAYGLDPTPEVPAAPGADPLTNRLLLLNASLGSIFVPGLDGREPAAEAGSVEVLGSLPNPPDPPDRGGGN